MDDGETPPLHTQLISQYSPLVDAPDAPESPPLHIHEEMRDANYLASKRDLPRDFLTAAEDKLFGIC